MAKQKNNKANPAVADEDLLTAKSAPETSSLVSADDQTKVTQPEQQSSIEKKNSEQKVDKAVKTKSKAKETGKGDSNAKTKVGFFSGGLLFIIGSKIYDIIKKYWPSNKDAKISVNKASNGEKSSSVKDFPDAEVQIENELQQSTQSNLQSHDINDGVDQESTQDLHENISEGIGGDVEVAEGENLGSADDLQNHHILQNSDNILEEKTSSDKFDAPATPEVDNLAKDGDAGKKLPSKEM